MPKGKHKRRKAKRYVPRKRSVPDRSGPVRAPESFTVDELMATTRDWPERILVDVGMRLRDGRTCQPVADADSYDRAVGIEYQAIDIETCGFRIVAAPRRIGVREVAAHADRSCRRCHGLGYWSVTRHANAGLDDAGNKRMQVLEYEQSCGCAERAFKRQFQHILVDSQLGEWIALDGLSITVTAREATG